MLALRSVAAAAIDLAPAAQEVDRDRGRVESQHEQCGNGSRGTRLRGQQQERDGKLDRRQRFERIAATGRQLRHGVAERRSIRVTRDARRAIHDLTDHGVFAPQVVPDDAAKRASRRDADSGALAATAQRRMDRGCSLHAGDGRS